MMVRLCGKQGAVKAWAVVDSADDELVAGRRWHITDSGYARSFDHVPGQRSPKATYLHRLICGLREGDGLTVDHISGNKLDNRRANLRVVDRSANARNRGHEDGAGTSRIRGVHFASRDRKWRAQVKVSGKAISLGDYRTEHEAEAAVRTWRLEHDRQPRMLASISRLELVARRADP